jgi:hypothetical protein
MIFSSWAFSRQFRIATLYLPHEIIREPIDFPRNNIKIQFFHTFTVIQQGLLPVYVYPGEIWRRVA